jgi:enoyl-[acyl-carrier protein] reductase II
VRRFAERQSGPHPGCCVADNQGVTNRIQSLLGVQYPVVQAPMTYIARAELAAAVS